MSVPLITTTTVVDAPSADGGATDPLVCSKCTFDNSVSTSVDQLLPAPSACAVCLSPLEVTYTARPEQHHQLGTRATAEMDKAANAQDGDTTKTYGVINAADFVPAAVMTVDDAIAKQCPVCTVLLPDASGSTCPVCSSSLAPSDSVSEVPLECGVCTLWNDYGATVCSACETPFGSGTGGGVFGHDQSGMLRFVATARGGS